MYWIVTSMIPSIVAFGSQKLKYDMIVHMECITYYIY